MCIPLRFSAKQESKIKESHLFGSISIVCHIKYNSSRFAEVVVGIPLLF